MNGKKHFAVHGWKRASAVCAMMAAMVAAMALPALSQSTARANRITGEVTAGALTPLKGSVHPLTRQATDLGEVDSAMQMDALTLNTGLSSAQQADVDALLAAQQDPKSPQYHQWLTQEEYGARFGLTDADLRKVSAWLASQGFTVKGVSKSRNAIYFSGKAWQVESAFHTQLHRYQLAGETHFANASELQLPAGLAQVALNVRGLNNFRLKPNLRRPAVPAYTVNTTQGVENFLAPGDWSTIYDVNAIYNAGYTGTGAYVGVVGQTYAPQADIDHFRSAAGLSATKLIYACIDSKASNCTGTAAISTTGDLTESDLDIEWAGGIAKNATVVFVYAPYSDSCTNAQCTTSLTDPVTGNGYGVFDALQRAVEDYTVSATGKVLPVISMSYTDCEESLAGDSSYADWIKTVGSEANTQGQTLVVAAGDTGPAGCDYNTAQATLGISATVPVDSPNYTGVGGTTLSGDESTPSEYWNENLASQSDILNSALGYIPETVWNDTVSDGTLAASSGGVSQYFAQPSWQNGLISGQTAWRMVPDVAFTASADHDSYLICSQDNNSSQSGTDCASGFASSKGYLDLVGGTSGGAPSFAGMLTLLAQAFGSSGTGLGNVNPTLYGLASNATTYKNVFHDVQSGNNIVPCESTTTDPSDTGCVNGKMGYTATAGYDLTTGLGSIDGGALYTAMGGTLAPTATTTAVSASTNPVALTGTTTLTATVNPAAATGSVTFKVGSKTLGSSAVSSGTATLSDVAVTSANGFTVGSDTITASYSGDSNYAASGGTTALTVETATYTVTSPTATVSIAAGGMTQINLGLVSNNDGGSVSLKVASSNASAISASATPNPVTLASDGSGSTVLTITSLQSTSTNHSPALPWKSGGAIAFAVMLGAPFTRRRKRALAVLLTALGLSLAGLLTSCSGGSSSTGATSFTVTVTPQGTGTVTPVVITVNIQ